jgi:hypothetical protein
MEVYLRCCFALFEYVLFLFFSLHYHQEPSTVHKTPNKGVPNLPHPLLLITMVLSAIEIEAVNPQKKEVDMTRMQEVVLLIS